MILQRLPPQWKSFLRDNAYVSISTILIQGSSILFSALFARRSAEDFAFFQYFLSIVGLLAIFSFPGLGQSLKIEVARGAYPLDQFLKTKLKYGLLAAVIALIASGIFYIIGRAPIALTLIIAVPLLPPYYALPLYSTALEGKLQFDLMSKLQIVKTVTTNLLLVAFILLKGSAILISVMFLSLNILLDALILLYIRRLHPNKPLDPEHLSQAITYAKNLTLVSSLGIVRQNVDRFIVGSFLPATTLAVYAIAAGLSQRIRLVSFTVSKTIFPRIASLSEAKAQAVLRRQFPRWVGFTIVVCVAAGILARPYILIIYGHEYLDSVFLSYILILIMGLGMLSMPPGMLFESQRRTDILYRANALSSILEIILTSLLVPFFQIPGVLWSKGLARIYLFIALMHPFLRPKERSKR